MRISTLFYVFKQGIRNIFRNKWFSLASVATMSICLFLFGLFFAIIVNFQNIVKAAQEGVSIVVFFDYGIEDSRIDEIEELLKPDVRPEVADIKYLRGPCGNAYEQEYVSKMQFLSVHTAEQIKTDHGNRCAYPYLNGCFFL